MFGLVAADAEVGGIEFGIAVGPDRMSRTVPTGRDGVADEQHADGLGFPLEKRLMIIPERAADLAEVGIRRAVLVKTLIIDLLRKRLIRRSVARGFGKRNLLGRFRRRHGRGRFRSRSIRLRRANWRGDSDNQSSEDYHAEVHFVGQPVQEISHARTYTHAGRATQAGRHRPTAKNSPPYQTTSWRTRVLNVCSAEIACIAAAELLRHCIGSFRL